MILTSADYKTQVQNNRFWHGKVQIDYTDYNIDNTITTSVSNPDILSDDSQMVDGVESPTFEWIDDWSTFAWSKRLRSQASTENEKEITEAIVYYKDKMVSFAAVRELLETNIQVLNNASKIITQPKDSLGMGNIQNTTANQP